MKAPSTSVKESSTRKREPFRPSIDSLEVEEEPPGETAAQNDTGEEPPGKSAKRHPIFSRVPDRLWHDWRWQFRNRITSVEALARFVPLSPEEQVEMMLVSQRYPLAITPYYLSLINPDNPNDPVRKQAIPSILEITPASLGFEDPLEEARHSVVPGLVHRYPDRVLMVLTDICPMLCRHCTRKREWQHGGWVRTPAQVEAMLDYIRRHK